MKKIVAIVLIIIAVIGIGITIKLISNGYFNKSQPTYISDELPEGTEVAIFSGGCFWCMEKPFEELEGVVSVTSGYTGGSELNPTYKQVSSGSTGHIESVQIIYKPDVISYETLLDVYWRQIDPTDDGGQFVDRGNQYRSAIFYVDDQQKKMAEDSKKELEESGVFEKPIVTGIFPAKEFYVAEDYHQDYYIKNPVAYKHYRKGSGRDQFVEPMWKDRPLVISTNAGKSMYSENNPYDSNATFIKPSDKELKMNLTTLQYEVTQEDATEPPFKNEYWDNKEEGIYVDIISGEPLFSSIDKYDSGTGWPSFTQPIPGVDILEKEDNSLFHTRSEVRSQKADSHLGHVFDDGPAPTGLRYCLNSASLLFIPKDMLVESGYASYESIFQN